MFQKYISLIFVFLLIVFYVYGYKYVYLCMYVCVHIHYTYICPVFQLNLLILNEYLEIQYKCDQQKKRCSYPVAFGRSSSGLS